MCWSSHQGHWETRRVEPVRAPDLRVSDADRQAVIDQLSRHTGEGRLTLDEFEARVDEVLEAKKSAELQHALRELPTRKPVAAHHRSFAPVQRLVGMLAILVGLAFIVGPWVLFFAIPLVARTGRHYAPPQSRDEELLRV